MKYLDYINMFWKLNDIEVFTLAESKVYFFLLTVANRNGWIMPFNCSDSLATCCIGISVNTFKGARASLQKRNMITFEIGGKGQHRTCRYQILTQKLIPKVTPSNDEGCQFRYQILTPKVTDKESTKEINNKEIDKENSLERKKESVLTTYSHVAVETEPPLVAPVPIEDILIKIRTTEQAWIERFCMNNNITTRDFNIMSDLFIKELENRNIKSKTIADYQSHFAKWFVIQKEKKNAKSTNHRLAQKQQLTNTLAGTIASNLAKCDADYLREQAGQATEEDVRQTDTTDSRLLSGNGEYPFG